jgi:CRP-like cAMP-binding protein
MKADDITSLEQIALFTGLSRAESERLLAAARTQKVPDGGFFFLQGDPAEHIYVLQSGLVRLGQVTAEGQQVLQRVIGPGTMFGAVALMPDAVYPVSAEAAADSQALSWSTLQMMSFVKEMPTLALNALRMMAKHVQEVQDRFRELATQRVERRLAGALLRLASQTGRKVEEGVLIDLALSRQDLAEMTGTTLYTVSRILSQWEEKGLIRSGRERVIIRYPHGLVTIAEDIS